MADQRIDFITIKEYESPVGVILLGSFQNELVLCDWKYRKMRKTVDNRIQVSLKSEYQLGTSPAIDLAIEELESYFKGTLKKFSSRLKLVGSDFQGEVWKQLLAIPYGETLSYHELSEKLGNPKAIRAVASANGANALSIFVPCHRIIASDGSLKGYAGGLRAKKSLLELESALPQLSIDFG